MKIALVIERMDAGRGGREAATAEIAAGLAARGREVDVLCQRGDWRHPGVGVHALGGSGLFRVERLRRFVAAVRDVIAGGHYDVVHAMLPIPGANVYQPRGGTVPAQAAAAVRRRGPLAGPLARLAAPLNLRRREMARLEETVVAVSGALCLAVSRMVAREFAEHYHRRDGVRVIYNAAEVPHAGPDQRRRWREQRRGELDVGPDEPVFITVAHNFPLKGVAEAVAAFARWLHSRRTGGDGRLVVVGPEPTEAYRSWPGRKGVARHVVFVPPAGREDLFQWYSAADACILLSWYDPCSRVILEAVRWGLPSLTTVFNGAAEVLERGAGVVVPSPRDIRAVAAGMAELVDPARRASFAEQCAQVADRLGMARHVDELLDAYGEVGACPC